MDNSASREQDSGYDLDLERGIGAISGKEDGSVDTSLDEKLEKTVFFKLCDGIMSANDSCVESDLKVNAKRKKGSNAKKPPRPPRGLSLDGSDQKLLKELAELAIIKRARIERMKALTQKKASKISSSSHGSFFAMLFTIIFFLVIFLQGRNSVVTIQASPQITQTNGNGLIAMQSQTNLSTTGSISPNYKSSTLI